MAKIEVLDTDKINNLVNLSLADARANAISMINSEVFKVKTAKKNRLIYDIQRASTPAEVCRIMYFTYLAGTGLGVTGSSWQSHFKEV